MGPFGAIGTLVTIGLTTVYRRFATPFDEWYAALFPEETLESLVDTVCGKVQNGSGVASFTDILAFGTLEQKQELLALLTKQFRPAFAPVLKLALRDSSNAIRVQAASAVAKLENDFTIKSLHLSESLQEGESVPLGKGDSARSAQGVAKRLLDLAVHYDEYAATGLLDADREVAAVESALKAYRRYLDLEPDNLRACASYGKLLLKTKALTEAKAWLASCLTREKPSSEILMLYMDTLFQIGDYAGLRNIARGHHSQILEEAGFLDETGEAVKLWAGVAC